MKLLFFCNLHAVALMVPYDYTDLPDLITKISWKLGFLYLQVHDCKLN